MANMTGNSYVNPAAIVGAAKKNYKYSKKDPFIANMKPVTAAGINPKTGGPNDAVTNRDIKGKMKKVLKKVDVCTATNRYVWYNLPCDLTSQELERLIYYRDTLVFFYDELSDKFYFMIPVLDGESGLDFYGRWNGCQPIPYVWGKEKTSKEVTEYLSKIHLKCVYGIKQYEDLEYDDLTKSGVILHDSTREMDPNNSTSRCATNEPLIDLMSECPAYMRTSMINSCGTRGLKVEDADQKSEVTDVSRGIQEAALEGDPFVAITSRIELQELADKGVAKSEEFMLAMQSLDNLRLSTYGIDNGGLFEKKSYMNYGEANVNGGPVGMALQDGLSIRQEFCNIVNSIWGIGIWCEINECLTNTDVNGDGQGQYQRDDQSASSGNDIEGGNKNDDSGV